MLSAAYLSLSVFSPQTVSALRDFSEIFKPVQGLPTAPIPARVPNRVNRTPYQLLIKRGYESDNDSDSESDSDEDVIKDTYYYYIKRNFPEYYKEQVRRRRRAMRDRSNFVWEYGTLPPAVPQPVEPCSNEEMSESHSATDIPDYEFHRAYINEGYDSCDSDREFSLNPPRVPIHMEPRYEEIQAELNKKIASRYKAHSHPEEFIETYEPIFDDHDTCDSDGHVREDCDRVSEKGFDASDEKTRRSHHTMCNECYEPPPEHYSDYEDEYGNPTDLYEIHSKMRIKAKSQDKNALIKQEMDQTIAKAEHIVNEYQEKIRHRTLTKEMAIHFGFGVRALYEAAVRCSRNIHPLEIMEDYQKIKFLDIYRQIKTRLEIDYSTKHKEYSSVMFDFLVVRHRKELDQLCEDSVWNILYMSRVWFQTSNYFGERPDFANKIFTEYLKKILDVTSPGQTFDIKPLY